jgi:Lon protease-like protein
MPAQLEELPLYPLHTVLFPYASLRILIQDDRYREMVRSCLDNEKPFGIVLIRSGDEEDLNADPYMVGTAARIVQAETYEDGRMQIQVQGERRFRIRELDDVTSPYLLGRVEPVQDDELQLSQDSERLILEARTEFVTLIQRLLAREHVRVRVDFPPDPVALSFTIANLLPIENLDKQRLLETTDTLDRVEGLLPLIRTQIREAAPSLGTFKLTTQDLQEWILPN